MEALATIEAEIFPVEILDSVANGVYGDGGRGLAATAIALKAGANQSGDGDDCAITASLTVRID